MCPLYATIIATARKDGETGQDPINGGRLCRTCVHVSYPRAPVTSAVLETIPLSIQVALLRRDEIFLSSPSSIVMDFALFVSNLVDFFFLFKRIRELFLLFSFPLLLLCHLSICWRIIVGGIGSEDKLTPGRPIN